MKIVLEQAELEQIIREHVKKAFPTVGEDLQLNIVNGRGANGTSVEIDVPVPGASMQKVTKREKVKNEDESKQVVQAEEVEEEPVKEKPVIEKQPPEEAEKKLANVFRKAKTEEEA